MSVVSDNNDNMLLPPGKIITPTKLNLSSNQGRPLSVMVLGKPGEGKSSLLNGILGQQAFVAKLSVSVSIIAKSHKLYVRILFSNAFLGKQQEVTKHVVYRDGSWLGGDTDIPIRCIDTPPISGRLDDTARISNECQRMLELSLPGIDAFLVVIKLSRYRYVLWCGE
jgi:septin family protein